jgi:hypothetical protein
VNEKIQRRRFLVEETKLYKGYRYMVVAMDLGHRCGYVLVPPYHPYCGNDYDHFPIDCHGGLTFAQPCEKDSELYPESGYWIGFDCGHAGDRRDPKILKLLGNEIMISILSKYKIGGEYIRTTAYVRKECKNIIRQLRETMAKAECCPFLL